MMNQSEVILVDQDDNVLGTMDKQAAHISGDLHRAFSVFIFNSAGQLLIHQRNPEKYHTGGLWTNTCCSHPRMGESTHEAAVRRLQEEMGMSTELTEIFSFVYQAELANGLTEHEYDHVFIGYSDLPPVPDKEEVHDWKYVEQAEVLRAFTENPDLYTPWFKLCARRVFSIYSSRKA